MGRDIQEALVRVSDCRVSSCVFLCLTISGFLRGCGGRLLIRHLVNYVKDKIPAVRIGVENRYGVRKAISGCGKG